MLVSNWQQNRDYTQQRLEHPAMEKEAKKQRISCVKPLYSFVCSCCDVSFFKEVFALEHEFRVTSSVVQIVCKECVQFWVIILELNSFLLIKPKTFRLALMKREIAY